MSSRNHELDFRRRVEHSLGILRAVVGTAAFILVATEKATHLPWEWWIETPGWAIYALVGVATILLLRGAPSPERIANVRRMAVAADGFFLLIQPVLHVSDNGQLDLSPILLFPVLVAARFAMRGAIAGTGILIVALLATDQFTRRVNGWGLDPDDAIVVALLALSAAVVGGALTRAASAGRALADEEAERARTEAARAERATATMQGVHLVLTSGIAAGVHAACARMAQTIQTLLNAENVTIRLTTSSTDPSAGDDAPASGTHVEITSGKDQDAAHTSSAPIRTGATHMGELVIVSQALIDRDELGLLADQVGLAAHAAHLLDEEARLAGKYRDLDRLRSDFLALAAHELRTPTTAIHGALATIASRGDALSDDVNRQLLDAAGRQTGRLIQLADDLLMIGRSDTGAIPVRIDEVDVADIVASAVESIDPTTGVLLVEGPACDMHADAARTEQVLTNLLANAGTHGLAPVKISWEVVEGSVEIRVTDHGHLGPVERERVFERFYVGELSSHTRGSGLGLPLSRDLAEAMQGRLTLDESAPTTSFVLALPLVDRAATPA